MAKRTGFSVPSLGEMEETPPGRKIQARTMPSQRGEGIDEVKDGDASLNKTGKLSISERLYRPQCNPVFAGKSRVAHVRKLGGIGDKPPSESSNVDTNVPGDASLKETMEGGEAKQVVAMDTGKSAIMERAIKAGGAKKSGAVQAGKTGEMSSLRGSQFSGTQFLKSGVAQIAKTDEVSSLRDSQSGDTQSSPTSLPSSTGSCRSLLLSEGAAKSPDRRKHVAVEEKSNSSPKKVIPFPTFSFVASPNKSEQNSKSNAFPVEDKDVISPSPVAMKSFRNSEKVNPPKVDKVLAVVKPGAAATNTPIGNASASGVPVTSETSLPASASAPNEYLKVGSGPTVPRSDILLVSPRQRGNPVLRHLNGVAWQYWDLVPDFQVSPTGCVLFLSLRYYALNPAYIEQRLQQLGHSYSLRVLLVLADVSDPTQALKDLAKICLLSECTLVLAWGEEQAARYIETYKSYENKPPDMLMEKPETDFNGRATSVLTSIRSVNKTDALTLLSNFGSVSAILKAAEEDLMLCPGFGQQKAGKLHSVCREPFLKRQRVTRPVKK